MEIVLLLLFVLALIPVCVAIKRNKDSRSSPTSNFNGEFNIGKGEVKMPMLKRDEKRLNDDNFASLITIKTAGSLACARNPEIREGEKLKYSDPRKALEILLPICDIEKGNYVKHVCLQCYRNLKDYESERKMIHRILERIDEIQPDECDPLEYSNIKGSEDTYYKRLNFVNKRIESIKKKEADALKKKRK